MESGNSRSRDIHAIWEQLKQPHQAQKDCTKLESLWKHVQAGSVAKHAPMPTPTKHAHPQQQQQQVSSSSSSSRNLSRQQDALDALKSGLQDGSAMHKVAQSLQSPDASVVKATLQQLQAVLKDAEAASALPTAKLCKALLRCFEHHTEACRDMAVSCLSSLLQADPDATLGLLPYVIPVLVERLQCDESHCPSEPSEEVRLQLVRLLTLLLEQAGAAIAAYASEVWSILTAVLKDSYHSVSMQGCYLAQQMAGFLGLRLGVISKELVAALLPLTTHKRYRVRVTAIQAIRDVMHQGAHEMILEMVAWRDPNLVPIKAFYGDDLKVNFCGKLATDPHVQVRLAFLDMIGNWMLTLRERLDHEARLLPYVLSGACDDSPAVVQSALQLLDQLGQQYEQEHEQQLADQIRFAEQLEGAAEAQLLQLLAAGTLRYAGSWDCTDSFKQATAVASAAGGNTHQQDGQQASHAAAGDQRQGQAAETAAGAAAALDTLALPGPFAQRARLGSRLLVRSTLSSLLPALCRELSSWQSCPRAMSARLLLVSLLLSESAAEQHLQVILPALCSSMSESDAGAAVQSCATLLGCFCSLPRLLDLLEPRLEDWAGQPQRLAAGLMLLAAVLRGAAAMQRISSSDGLKLLQLLHDQDLADSSDSSIQAAMLQLMQQLVAPGTLQQLLSEGGGKGQPQEATEAEAGAALPAASAGGSGPSGVAAAVQKMLVQLLTQLQACQAVAAADTAAQEWLTAALQRVQLC